MNGLDQLKLWARYNRVTATLISLSIIVALMSKLGRDFQFIQVLFISEFRQGLPEIIRGQLWRLFTPIIIHFGIMHIAFNLLWLYQLGSAIEQRQNSRRMLILVIIISVLSNLAQFIWSGPIFGGMSGVVYGLLAYVWAQGKFNPYSGLHLDKNTTLLMMLWFFACWFGLVGNIANMAHTIGLVSGIVLGLIYSPQFLRKFK
ncbi:MAG: rhomboid family intramembrane serine protease [Woeseiaceae bacterium]